MKTFRLIFAGLLLSTFVLGSCKTGGVQQDTNATEASSSLSPQKSSSSIIDGIQKIYLVDAHAPSKSLGLVGKLPVIVLTEPNEAKAGELAQSSVLKRYNPVTPSRNVPAPKPQTHIEVVQTNGVVSSLKVSGLPRNQVAFLTKEGSPTKAQYDLVSIGKIETIPFTANEGSVFALVFNSHPYLQKIRENGGSYVHNNVEYKEYIRSDSGSHTLLVATELTPKFRGTQEISDAFENGRAFLHEKNYRLDPNFDTRNALIQQFAKDKKSLSLGSEGDLEINGEQFQYKITKVLGKGSFGEILLVQMRNKDGGSAPFEFAIKKQTVKKDDDRDRLIKEISTTEAMSKHPNSVQFFGAYKGPGSEYYIGLEKLDNGLEALRASLMRDQGRSVERSLRDLAEVLRSLYKAGYLHRDLKLGNIMIDSQGRVVLIDYGLTARKEEPSDGGTIFSKQGAQYLGLSKIEDIPEGEIRKVPGPLNGASIREAGRKYQKELEEMGTTSASSSSTEASLASMERAQASNRSYPVSSSSSSSSSSSLSADEEFGTAIIKPDEEADKGVQALQKMVGDRAEKAQERESEFNATKNEEVDTFAIGVSFLQMEMKPICKEDFAIFIENIRGFKYAKKGKIQVSAFDEDAIRSFFTNPANDAIVKELFPYWKGELKALTLRMLHPDRNQQPSIPGVADTMQKL